MSTRAVVAGSYAVFVVSVIAACESFEGSNVASPDASAPDAPADSAESDGGVGPADAASDAADAGAACDLAWPFGPGVTLTELGTVSDLTLSDRDDLEVIVSKKRDGGPNGLFRASRTSRSAPFGTPQPITEVNQHDPDFSLRGGALSSDGLTLLYFFNSVGGPPFEIYVATRPTQADSFNAFAKVGIEGFDAGRSRVHPHWSNQNSVLFSGQTPEKVYRAEWDGGTNALSSLASYDSVDSYRPQRAAESKGRDVLFFSANDGDGGPFKMYEARRTNDDLGTPREIKELALGGGTASQDISHDGCRIYFTDDSGNVHFAERRKPQ